MMTGAATKADLAAKEAHLKAVTELARLRLKVRLGAVLIANLVAMGLLLFATSLLLAP
jgi:hypothetical protein